MLIFMWLARRIEVSSISCVGALIDETGRLSPRLCGVCYLEAARRIKELARQHRKPSVSLAAVFGNLAVTYPSESRDW
jgi:hypothetical protein